MGMAAAWNVQSKMKKNKFSKNTLLNYTTRLKNIKMIKERLNVFICSNNNINNNNNNTPYQTGLWEMEIHPEMVAAQDAGGNYDWVRFTVRDLTNY